MDKQQYQVHLERGTVQISVTAESPDQAADQAVAQTKSNWWDVTAIRSEKK